jgi:hypothetical protein
MYGGKIEEETYAGGLCSIVCDGTLTRFEIPRSDGSETKLRVKN